MRGALIETVFPRHGRSGLHGVVLREIIATVVRRRAGTM
jgi:hypothetical protein